MKNLFSNIKVFNKKNSKHDLIDIKFYTFGKWVQKAYL